MFVNLTTTIFVSYVLSMYSNLIKIIPKFTNHHTKLSKKRTSKLHWQTLVYTIKKMKSLNSKPRLMLIGLEILMIERALVEEHFSRKNVGYTD